MARSEVVGLVLDARRAADWAHHLPDHLGSKAAPRQKTHLPQPVLATGGRLAEALLPDFSRALKLGGLQRLERWRELLRRQLMRAQFVLDSCGAEPPSPPPNQALDKALIRQELFRSELVEDGIKCVRVGRVRSQPCPKFGPAVFAPRQKPQCPRFEGNR